MTPSVDNLFQRALTLFDAGDAAGLDRLIAEEPRLVRERLESPGPWLRDKIGGALDGFLARPYLLWFVSEDAPRVGRLPASTVEMTHGMLTAIRRHAPETLQEQLDYALSLVCWSGVARDCGVQVPLIDLLVDAGARLDGNPENALVNGHFDAAERVLARGAPLSLAVALCLGRLEEGRNLGDTADADAKQFALVLCALRGRPAGVRAALTLGADPRRPSHHLYSHGTPLHHAVYSGSLEAVQALVEAGAPLDARDSLWKGTPLDWAEHALAEPSDPAHAARVRAIAEYLRSR